MKILMVLTSHSELGNTGKKTGFWIEEFAAPYYVFKEAGAEVMLASPKGGQPPIDPASAAPDAQTEATKRFNHDSEVQELLAHTSKLADMEASAFDAVFYPGGHGPLWDLYASPESVKIIEDFWESQKPVAAVCHAPAVLLNVKDKQGNPLVKGRSVTGFTNTEEEAVGLTNVVPYLLENELKNRGGRFSRGEDWASYVVRDGRLITGQNPASSEEAAKVVLTLLKESAEQGSASS